MKKLRKYPRVVAYNSRVGHLEICTEQDGCSCVIDTVTGQRGPKKHSRKAALLAFWNRGFIA